MALRVLVTGGTGVIGESAVRALHRAGHAVRVLSRNAGRDQKWWPEGVDGWVGDVSDGKSVRGAAEGCDAVVHVAGIAEEKPPAITFQRVNVDGTRHTVLEAERAGVARFVYISSLGADRGGSAYHKSKRAGEDVVRTFSRDWVVLRPGAVYGPGDGHLSVLLRMVRALPVVPTIGDGNQPFQPIWHEDFAGVVVAAVERGDVRSRAFEIAGADVTSQNDLVARFRRLTGRQTLQAPLPEMIAEWGLRTLDTLGVAVPFNESQLAMLTEGNVVGEDGRNALTEVFGISPTRLDDGLRRLAGAQPEQLPSQGVGALTRKDYRIAIRDGRYDADGLFEYLRTHLPELMPSMVPVKRDSRAAARIEEGETLTLELPVRGQVQVRVAEVRDRRMTLLTVAGHPIAGAVRFCVEPTDGAVQFAIEVYDRAASVIDELLMRTVGAWLQRDSWIEFARNVARAAGGPAGDVRATQERLTADQLEVVNEWAATLSAQLSRSSAPGVRS